MSELTQDQEQGQEQGQALGRMRALVERVEGLTREEAIEAALALADEVAATDTAGTAEAARSFAEQVEAAPYAHLPEIDNLARALLIATGSSDQWGPQTDEVIDGVGQKAFVFGATEIVALAALGVMALALVLSRGRSREKEKIELHEDGKLVYERETVYATGPKLLDQLTKIITGFRQP